MITILHGENALQRGELVAAVVTRSGLSPDFGDINTETLTDSISAGELRRACLAIPFLGDVRLVIVRDALAKLKGDEAQAIADLLSEIPPTTWLIFDEGHALLKKHPVLSAAAALGAEVTTCVLPDTRDPHGSVNGLNTMGGKIDARAATPGPEHRSQPIAARPGDPKLLLYVGEDAPITAEDVNVMVPYISRRMSFSRWSTRWASAMHASLHPTSALLDVGEHPLGIFGMIVRQFRLLVQVRWMSDHRQKPQIVSRLKLHPCRGKVYARRLASRRRNFGGGLLSSLPQRCCGEAETRCPPKWPSTFSWRSLRGSDPFHKPCDWQVLVTPQCPPEPSCPTVQDAIL